MSDLIDEILEAEGRAESLVSQAKKLVENLRADQTRRHESELAEAKSRARKAAQDRIDATKRELDASNVDTRDDEFLDITPEENAAIDRIVELVLTTEIV